MERLMHVTTIKPDALAAGCPDAWETLRVAYVPLCLHHASPAGLDAADVWQEAALRLWRALQARRFEGRSGPELGAYLALAIRSAAIDLGRPADARAHWAPYESWRGTATEPGYSVVEAADFWRLVTQTLGDDALAVLGRLLERKSLGSDQDAYNRQRNGLGKLRRRRAALLAAYTGEHP
jgi:DNA-directed RNA polymerase specialized sigma24 family protein